MNDEKQPQQPLLWVLLATILGLFAINVPKQAGENGAAARNAKEERDAAKLMVVEPDVNEDHPALRPLRKYLGLFPNEPEKTASEKSDSNKNLKCALQFHRVESLIVTVLDPIDSHLPYVFDQTVAVVDMAMSACEFVRDRSWLPWEQDKRAQADEKKAARNLRRRHPGVLLYRSSRSTEPRRAEPRRSDGSKGELCVVFLIGETPTKGIQKLALSEALDLIDDYQLYPLVAPNDKAKGEPKNKANDESSKRIRIVGPACSGSESSLQTAVGEWIIRREVSKDGLAQLLFGTPALGGMPTTSGTCSLVLQFAERRNAFGRISGSAMAIKKKKGDVLPIKTALRSADELGDAVRHYIEKRSTSQQNDPLEKDKQLEPANTRIAFLCESNTGFGASFSAKQFDNKALAELPKTKSESLYLPFPVHISLLKKALDHDRQQQEAKLALPGSGGLVPHLRQEVEDADAYPAQDPTTTARINGKALDDLFRTIIAEKIQYVGIIATDARDQIFLTHALRKVCPGVQVFILGSDLLQTMPDESYDLKGTLIASTYPMFLPNQRWTAGAKTSHIRMAFAGDGPQGNYNAILALMGQKKKLLEYRPPYFPDLKKADPDASKYPPIWISVIGQSGDLVPLQFFTPKNDDLYRLPDSEESAHFEHFNLPTTGVIGIAIACLGCLVFLYREIVPNGTQLLWYSKGAAAGQPMSCKTLSGEAFFFRTVCLLSLAVLLCPIVVLMAIYQSAVPLSFFAGVLSWIPLSILYLLLAAAIWPLLWSWSVTRNRRTLDKSLGRVTLSWTDRLVRLCVAAAILAAFSAPILLQRLGGANSWHVLFLVRTLDLQNGVSILVPLFFLAMASFSWGCSHVHRCYLRDSPQFATESPFSRVNTPLLTVLRRMDKCDYSAREIESRDRNVQLSIQDILSRWKVENARRVDVLVCVGIAVLFWYLAEHVLLPTIEGGWWDAAAFVGFFLGVLMFALTMARFLFAWKTTEKLMRAISLLPMARAFDDLPDKVKYRFGGYLTAKRPRTRHRLIAAHQLRQLSDAIAALETQEGMKRIDELARTLAERFECPAGQDGERAKAAAEPGTATELCQLLFQVLRPIWLKRSTAEAFGVEPLKAEALAAAANPTAEALKTPGWVKPAEAFLASWIVVYISQYFVQMRNCSWILIICSAALLLAGSSYPFFPEQMKLIWLLGLVLCGLGAVVFVLVQVNKNELVSRIMRTTANQFDLDRGFVMSLLTYALPLTAFAIGSLGAFRFILEPVWRLLK